MKLEGKIAIVTGAGRGLGRGIALCFAEDGADLVICSRTPAELDSLAEEVKALGRNVLAVKVDATNYNEVKQLAQKTIDTFGRVDILVNNVGGGRSAPGVSGVSSGDASKKDYGIANLDDEDWDGTYEVNLKTAVYMCRAIVPYMQEKQSGKIINIASVAAKIGDSYRMPYSAMKAAMVNFTWALAKELARDNINVNCICPGLIYTPLWQHDAERLMKMKSSYKELAEPKEVFMRYVNRLVPLGREQTAEDIGRAVAFFASEDAKNITGQSLNVDGGMVME